MKKAVSFLIFIAMTVTNISAFAKDYPQSFWDVPKDNWAFEYVQELVDRGVISGYEDGSFKPNNTVTRAEWAKMMVVAENLQCNDTNVYYSDMQGHWSIPYVNAAKDYLTSFTDGSYRPDQAVTREAVTIALVALKGFSLNNIDYSAISRFTDLNSISDAVKPYVAVAVNKGLISGYEDNTFRGQGTLTRAEAAVLLYKAAQIGGENIVINQNTSSSQIILPSQSTTQSQNTSSQSSEVANSVSNTASQTQGSYTVDTITEADLTASWTAFYTSELRKYYLSNLYTSDNNDNIYYFHDDIIYKANIYSGKTEALLSTYDIDWNGGNELRSATLLWDNKENRLILELFYGENFRINNHTVFAIYENDYEGVRITASEDQPASAVINGSNLYFCPDYIDTYEASLWNGKCYYIYDDEGEYGLYCDNFTTQKKVAKLYSGNNYHANTVKNNRACIWDKTIRTYDFDGTLIEEFSPNDVSVADYVAFDGDNAAEKLVLTNSGDIVFYDKSVEAFRIIKKSQSSVGMGSSLNVNQNSSSSENASTQNNSTSGCYRNTNIPDFGAVVGVSAMDYDDDDDFYSYYYNFDDIDNVSDATLEYIEYVESKGFEQIKGGTEGNTMTLLYDDGDSRFLMAVNREYEVIAIYCYK